MEFEVVLVLVQASNHGHTYGGEGTDPRIFRRVRKTAKSFVMSVRPSVLPHEATRLPLDGFS